MNPRFRPERYLLLYIPWILSLVFSADAITSYIIAWSGSFFIFYLSMGGKIKPVPGDMLLEQQLMRPLFLTQLVFAGYMCCTSIFYFFDVLGYENFQAPPPNLLIDAAQLELVAQCQRYYCLGHAALVTGILCCMNYPVKHKYDLKYTSFPRFLLTAALLFLALSLILKIIPGLSQFYFQLSSLSFIAGTLALAFAIPLKKPRIILLCMLLYGFNFYQALLSGYKEPIIVNVLVLGVFLYPFYKKAVVVVFIPVLLILFTLLPTYNRIFRENAWADLKSSDEASQIALDETFNPQYPEDDSDWGFLSGRLSEISMFTKYVQSTPQQIGYYGFDLIGQSLITIIPRAFWPDKPNLEQVVMERVYQAGVINRLSGASAKPPLVVDGYLSGGTLGVFLTLFIYGMLAQLISLKAEKLFGGYLIGTALIYSGLFQMFWRGLSFEFLINAVFWSYISMLIIFRLLRITNILKKAG